MKHVLLATVLVIVPTFSYADTPVIDTSNLRQMLTQVQTAAKQLTELQRAYTQLTNIYNAVEHGNYIAAIAPALRAGGLQSAVPVASSIPMLLSGHASLGTIGMIASQAGQFASQNAGSTNQKTNVTNDANAVANLQSMATGQITAMQNQQAELGQLQTALDSSTDLKTTADLQAKIALIKLQISQEQVKATNLTQLAVLQDQAIKHRNEMNYQNGVTSMVNASARGAPIAPFVPHP